MKISMDKLYQTRDGQNVELITVNGRGLLPVMGYIGSGVDVWGWNEFGVMSGPRSKNLDLVARPVEHVQTVYVGLFDDGSIQTSNGFEILKKFPRVIAISALKVTLTEGVFEETPRGAG